MTEEEIVSVAPPLVPKFFKLMATARLVQNTIELMFQKDSAPKILVVNFIN